MTVMDVEMEGLNWPWTTLKGVFGVVDDVVVDPAAVVEVVDVVVGADVVVVVVVVGAGVVVVVVVVVVGGCAVEFGHAGVPVGMYKQDWWA